MKKLIVMKSVVCMLVVCFLMVSVAGCGGKSTPSNSSATSGNKAGEETSKPAVNPIKISIAGPVPEDTPSGKALEELAKKINEYSNGTLQATVFHNGTLGNSTSMVEGLQQGTVDIATTGNSYFSAIVPEIQVFELPYLFQDRDEAIKALSGPVADELKSMFEPKGIKGLDFWGIGFRYLTNNKRPVKTPADLQGLKLRTLPANVQVRLWELLGALPTPIDSSEIYTALQQGVVDGQENMAADIYSNKYYEVQKYMTLTKHVFTPYFLGMSMKTWSKLDDSQKEAVIKAVQDATELLNVEAAKAEEKNIEELSKLMTVEKEPDLEAFREKAIGAYEVFTEKFGTDYIDRINEQLGKK